VHVHRLQREKSRLMVLSFGRRGDSRAGCRHPTTATEARETERMLLASSASQRFETRTLRTLQTLEEP